MHSMYPNFNNIKTISVGIDENEPQVNFLFAFKIMGCYYIKRAFPRVGLILPVNYLSLAIAFCSCFILQIKYADFRNLNDPEESKETKHNS